MSDTKYICNHCGKIVTIVYPDTCDAWMKHETDAEFDACYRKWYSVTPWSEKEKGHRMSYWKAYHAEGQETTGSSEIIRQIVVQKTCSI